MLCICLLIVNLFLALLVLGTAWFQATCNALDFYESTLVTMYHAVAAGAAAVLGLLVGRLRLVLLVVSSLLLAGMPISCYVGGSGYPGGDDGGGLGWLFFVGLSSLAACGLGIATGVVGVCLRPRKPRDVMYAEP